ncbi:MAG TPA: ethanolamine ammonia-lyase subunit EutC [Aquabacterium sp.]|nr:ethanolamine ammonia-lyase subunit EutC [Aquabacterium sp.]HQC95606.1 ethanolamine ammonia-lyase subunit EutC [Aquabacterium sp.]
MTDAMRHIGDPLPDPWADLRRHTPARIALGRSGAGLPTHEVLRLAAAHAQARDAVHMALDVAALQADLAAAGLPCGPVLHSQAIDRATYLRRPDLGRLLAPASADALQADEPVDLALVLADGLSAVALQRHAVPLLQALHAALAGRLAIARPVIALQARVALGDPIGAALQARLVLVLIGERPGLSSPDSLGAYLTHAPKPGCHDAQRNCVSNIRPDGLAPALAAARLAWLVTEALRRRLTGVGLKDDSATALLGATQPAIDTE